MVKFSNGDFLGGGGHSYIDGEMIKWWNSEMVKKINSTINCMVVFNYCLNY